MQDVKHKEANVSGRIQRDEYLADQEAENYEIVRVHDARRRDQRHGNNEEVE